MKDENKYTPLLKKYGIENAGDLEEAVKLWRSLKDEDAHRGGGFFGSGTNVVNIMSRCYALVSIIERGAHEDEKAGLVDFEPGRDDFQLLEDLFWFRRECFLRQRNNSDRGADESVDDIPGQLKAYYELRDVVVRHDCIDPDHLDFRLKQWDRLHALCKKYGAVGQTPEAEGEDPDMGCVEDALKLRKEAEDWHDKTNGDAFDMFDDLVPMLMNYSDICDVLLSHGIGLRPEDLREHLDGHVDKIDELEMGCGATEKLLAKYGLKSLDELESVLKSHGVEPVRKFRVCVDYDHTFDMVVEAKDKDEAAKIGAKIAEGRAKEFSEAHGFDLDWSGHDIFVEDHL